MSWTEFVSRSDGLSTLYALPLRTGAWSATGAVVGDNSGQPKLYVFTGLVDGQDYGVYVQAGGSPAESDVLVATLAADPVDDTPYSEVARSTVIQLSDTSARQITWPTPSETLTGTVQWEGQPAKVITGVITFRETIDDFHFYDWAYDAADRPDDESSGVLVLTDGSVSTVIPVTFDLGEGVIRLTGPNTINVTVTDDSVVGIPIENALVTISRTGYTQTNATNASGVIEPFKVVSATWNITSVASGYTTYTADFAIAGNQNIEIEMSELPVSVPSDPDICRLTIGFTTVHGVPIVGAVVTPVLIAAPKLVTSGYALNEATAETTDSEGRVVLDLIQGITVRLDVDYNGKCYQIRVEVPNLASDTLELTV